MVQILDEFLNETLYNVIGRHGSERSKVLRSVRTLLIPVQSAPRRALVDPSVELQIFITEVVSGAVSRRYHGNLLVALHAICETQLPRAPARGQGITRGEK